jgi:hypothetical protein
VNVASSSAGHAPVIVFYVSGHGFGHASRVVEVINALGARDPGARIIIRSSAARWLFDVTLRTPVEVFAVVTDVGVVQRDSLHYDVDATARDAGAFYAELPARAATEAAFLRRCGATLVVGDLPPLAFEAAHAAGLPAVALGNFTWDWIYEAYPELMARAPHVVPAIKAAHRHVSRALRLPMWGGFNGWTCPIVDLPFVARHSVRSASDVRAHLGIAAGRRLVLASFGGLGIADLDLSGLARLDGYTVVTTGHALGFSGTRPDGLVLLDDRGIYASGLRYEDLVHAADAVVTKPGYGIIAECLAHETALLYTSRGHFAEYDVLVAAMPRFLRCGFIDHADLHAGRWTRYLDDLLAQPAPPERPPSNGADVAAGLIVEWSRGTY